MKSIERHIHVSEAGKNEFRSEILNRLAAFSHRNKQFTYGTHKALKEAIEKEIFERRKDTIHITTNTINPDPDQLEELNRVIKRMVQDLGYDPISANRALKYVARINQQG
jgi:serine protein kinase